MVVEFSSLDSSGGSNSFILTLIMVIIGLGSLIYFWTLYQKRIKPSLEAETKDSLLYMKVAYTTERELETSRQGYLRSLTSDRASLVISDRSVRKGTELSLDLANLKNPDGRHAGLVKGRVTHTKSLGGSPENVLVNVQFLESNVPVREFCQPSAELTAIEPVLPS
ncbi:MAG: hypothetical protein NTX25_06700 [Proteobacteria bacterium]|nr:hypothetical protein [Pseudomonadota bacterium]